MCYQSWELIWILYSMVLNTSQKLEIKYPKINLAIIVCFHQDKNQ